MIGSLLEDAGVGIGVDCYKRGSAILVIAEPYDTSSAHKLRVYTLGHAGFLESRVLPGPLQSLVMGTKAMD